MESSALTFMKEVFSLVDLVRLTCHSVPVGGFSWTVFLVMTSRDQKEDSGKNMLVLKRRLTVWSLWSANSQRNLAS